MSKNPLQTTAPLDLSTDKALRDKYEQLLEEEKGKRPSWENQSFSQKMDARFSGAASTFLAVAPVFLAFNFPAMILIPTAFAASAKEARRYDEKVNPEKYHEIKALERLAIETGKLQPPGEKHRVFGGDILGGGIGDYGTKLNKAIAELAPKVGAPKGIKYNSPRDSMNDLNVVSRSLNKAVTSVENSVKDFGKDSKKSTGKFFNLFSSQPPAQEGNVESENTAYKKILNFFKELFGLSKSSSSSAYAYNPEKVASKAPVDSKSFEEINPLAAVIEAKNQDVPSVVEAKKQVAPIAAVDPNTSCAPFACTNFVAKASQVR
jgi:hypothetical protein